MQSQVWYHSASRPDHLCIYNLSRHTSSFFYHPATNRHCVCAVSEVLNWCSHQRKDFKRKSSSVAGYSPLGLRRAYAHILFHHKFSLDTLHKSLKARHSRNPSENSRMTCAPQTVLKWESSIFCFRGKKRPFLLPVNPQPCVSAPPWLPAASSLQDADPLQQWEKYQAISPGLLFCKFNQLMQLKAGLVSVSRR